MITSGIIEVINYPMFGPIDGVMLRVHDYECLESDEELEMSLLHRDLC